jgi:subtilase family serine protease
MSNIYLFSIKKQQRPFIFFRRPIYSNTLQQVDIMKMTPKLIIQSNNTPSAKPSINPSATSAKPSINPNVPNTSFSAPQLINLYNVPSIAPAAGKRKVIIAIIVAYTYPNVKADLQTFWKSYANYGPNSTPPTLNVRTMPGATQNREWALEECLDVQMVCSINPNANIWVVEAKSAGLPDLLAAIAYATGTINADVISMSWGGSDLSYYSQYNTYFTNTTKCFCAATGDTNVVSWPSTVSNVIAVGGTTLLWNPNSPNLRTEFTWSGAGCGYSSTMAKPTYQNGVTSLSRQTRRAIPDVSLIANPQTAFNVVYAGNWNGVGGTSASTPFFSAIISLANQSRINFGKPTLTSVYNANAAKLTTMQPSNYVPTSNNIQQYLYNHILSTPSKYSADFYDITIGTDVGSTATGGTTTYSTAKGYDITTGLGSPNVSALCVDLCNNI